MCSIGNTCFRRKIGYHNKMHLHQASLKKYYCLPRLNPGNTVFKKNLPRHLISYVFLILTRAFSQQKSRLKFFDVIMPNTSLSFLLFSLCTEETSCNCWRHCAVFNTKICTHFFYKKRFFQLSFSVSFFRYYCKVWGYGEQST